MNAGDYETNLMKAVHTPNGDGVLIGRKVKGQKVEYLVKHRMEMMLGDAFRKLAFVAAPGNGKYVIYAYPAEVVGVIREP